MLSKLVLRLKQPGTDTEHRWHLRWLTASWWEAGGLPKVLIIRDCPEASLPKMFPWGLAFSEAHSCTRPPPAPRPELGLTQGQADNLDTVTSQCPDLGGEERKESCL